MRHTDELEGLVGVRKHPKLAGKYIADLAIAGLGRVDLGVFDTASKAGIVHDDAKMLAARSGLTAKPPERQRYNHPDRALRMIGEGKFPEPHPAIVRLGNRRGTELAAKLGVKVRDLPTASRVAAQLKGQLAALEARIVALEARR